MPNVHLVSLIHLVLLAFWGGVVLTEGVIELLPRRRRELHPTTVTFHYWIDLLVEAPLILGVLVTGSVLLAMVWPPTTAHLVKIGFAGLAVAANATCIALVIRRKRRADAGLAEDALWGISDRILLSAKLGLPLALVAAGIGFWLAHGRLAAALSGS